MDWFLDFAKVASVWMTHVQIAACAVVIWLYGPDAMEWFRKFCRKERPEEMDYILLGIVLGFLGDKVDAGYWLFAWNADWFDLQSRRALFDWGPVSNLVFRNTGTTLAALCHIIAAVKARTWKVRALLMGGWMTGFIHAYIMYDFRYDLGG